MENRAEPQKTEVVAKAKRRSFSAKYKSEILRQADACNERGAIGALLRREGLYSSHLSKWRQEVAEREVAALAPKKRGPQVTPIDPRDHELAALRRDHAKLQVRAERAEMLVDIQKKVSMLLGVEWSKISEAS